MSTATTTAPATYLSVTSTSTPSLNGSYGITGVMAEGVQAEVNAIALNNAFADGSASVNWPDRSGAVHSFTVAQFKELATAMALYRAQCAQYAAGIVTTVPAGTATIA